MNPFLLSAFADEASPDFRQQLNALQRNQITHLEIRGVNGKNIMQLTDDELREVRLQMEDAGVALSAIGSPIGKISITDDFAPHMEQFRRAVEIAQQLGTQRIRMFSFYMPKDEDPEDYFSAVVDRVGQMVAYGLQNQVYCCHENEKGIYGDVLHRVQKLHRAVPALRCVFDPANYIQCGDLPFANAQALCDRIDYMHIKDALLADGTVVPAGEGDGSIPEILTMLYRRQTPYLLTLEPHLHVFSGLSALQEEALTHKRGFRSGDEAFDAAVTALKTILQTIIS